MGEDLPVVAVAATAGVDRHDDALGAELARQSRRSGSVPATAAEFTATLSAPARSRARPSATDLTPPPTVRGMKTSSAARSTTCTMVARSSEEAVMSKQHELVGALGVVAGGEFHRVAGVAKPLELDALYDPSPIDVQAGDDPHGSHAATASLMESAPDNSARPTIAPASRRPAALRLGQADEVHDAEATPPEATTGRALSASTSREPRQVGAGPGSVPVDVCHHDPAEGEALEAFQGGLELEARRGHPAVHRHLTPDSAVRPARRAVVEADEDPAGPTIDHPGEHCGPLDCERADNNPCDAALQQRRGGALVTHPAAGLHGHAGSCGDVRARRPRFGEPPFSAASRSTTCRREAPAATKAHACSQRVAVDGLGGELAPQEAHAPAVADVDGGPQLQAQPPTAGPAQSPAKRASSARPAEADFSGWNWVPNMLPRSNATASSPPYSHVPTTLARASAPSGAGA